MPNDLSNYYRYRGSLTVPPCTEHVVWTVFKEHIFLSKKQASYILLHKQINYKNNIGYFSVCALGDYWVQ